MVGDQGEVIVTGEAVALDLRLARAPSRALAALLDLAVQGLATMGVTWLGAALATRVDPALASAVGLGLFVAVWLGYPVASEALWRGRTLGKAAMGLRVVRDDGGPVRFRQALVRGLFGLFLEKPGVSFGLAALASSLLNGRAKRVGDLAAGTVVLHERVPGTLASAPPMPPPLAGWATGLDLSRLSDDLAGAARQFLSRAHQLDPRAREDLGRRLTVEVAKAVAPPPPPGTPGWAYLAAVLAERRRRAETPAGRPPAAPRPPAPPPAAPPPSGGRFAPPS